MRVTSPPPLFVAQKPLTVIDVAQRRPAAPELVVSTLPSTKSEPRLCELPPPSCPSDRRCPTCSRCPCSGRRRLDVPRRAPHVLVHQNVAGAARRRQRHRAGAVRRHRSYTVSVPPVAFRLMVPCSLRPPIAVRRHVAGVRHRHVIARSAHPHKSTPPRRSARCRRCSLCWP